MPTITQTGPNSWRCTIRIKGHKPIHRTFNSKEKAVTFGHDTERDLRKGRKYTRGGPTIRELVGAFRAIREEGSRPVKPSTTEHYYLLNLVRLLGDVRLEEATPSRLAVYAKARLADGVQPSTVKEELGKLSTVITRAAIRYERALPNVVQMALPHLRYLGLVGDANERAVRLPQKEIDAILSRLSPQMQDVVRFAIATTARRGEITRLLWSDLDERTKCLFFRDRKDPREKAGNDMWVPLLDDCGYDAFEVVMRQPRIADRIFPVSPKFISASFLSACKESGIKGFHFHDLRHEAISRLFEAGYTIEEVPLVSGHKDLRNLKRYTNLRPESLHDKSRGTQLRRAHLQNASRHPDTSEA